VLVNNLHSLDGMDAELPHKHDIEFLVREGDRVRADFRDRHRITSELVVESRELLSWVHDIHAYWHAVAARERRRI
jgi:hypothetical protein